MRWLVVFLMFAGLAHGQENDRRRFTSEAFNKGEAIKAQMSLALWKLGHFHVTPVLGVRDLGYDENVFSTELNQREDFTVSPEAGLQTYLRMGKKWIWENRGTYNYRFYQDLDQLRGSEYGAKTRLHGLFKRVYFAMGADYRRDQQRINSEIDDRVFSKRNLTDLDLTVRILPRGHLTFKPELYSLRFEEDVTQGPDFSALERDELRFNLRYLHKAHPLFWPMIELSHDLYDFRSIGNFRDDSTTSSVYLGARNEYGKRLHYNVKLGSERLTFDRAPQLDDDIIGLKAFYNYKVTRRADVAVSLEQYPVYSVIQDYGYYVSRRVSFGFGYKVRGKVRVGPEFIVGENDYEKSVRPLPLLRNDDIAALNLKVDVPFANVLEWNLTLGYLERDSNLAGLSDEGFQFFSNISYKGRENN